MKEGRKKMIINSTKYSVYQLYEKVFYRKEILFERHDDYVQHYDVKESSLVIESILMGVPMPPFYMIEQRDGRKDILDGFKRMKAVLDFINNKYHLAGLCFYTEYQGCAFEQLPPMVKSRIENYELQFHIILPPVSSDMLNEIYYRLNKK